MKQKTKMLEAAKSLGLSLIGLIVNLFKITILTAIGVWQTVFWTYKQIKEKGSRYIKWVQTWNPRKYQKDGRPVKEDIEGAKEILAKTMLGIVVLGFVLFTLGVAFKQHVQARLDFKPELAVNEPTAEFKPEIDTNIAEQDLNLLKREYLEDGTDLRKLADAVAQAETGGCKAGSAKYNNCFGIIRHGQFELYETKEDSYEDFMTLWAKYYQEYPKWHHAYKYTGGDRTDNWLRIVNLFYND